MSLVSVCLSHRFKQWGCADPVFGSLLERELPTNEVSGYNLYEKSTNDFQS